MIQSCVTNVLVFDDHKRDIYNFFLERIKEDIGSYSIATKSESLKS